MVEQTFLLVGDGFTPRSFSAECLNKSSRTQPRLPSVIDFTAALSDEAATVTRLSSRVQATAQTETSTPFSVGNADGTAANTTGESISAGEATQSKPRMYGLAVPIQPVDHKSHPLVWHYTNATGFNGILGSGGLRASAVLLLNDRVEFEHGLQKLDFAMKLHSRHRWFRKPVVDFMQQALTEIRTMATVDRMFVACASLLQDSLSQWRGYGLSGSGYALGLDSKVDTARGDSWRTSTHWSPVIYDESQQEELAVETLTFIACAFYLSRDVTSAAHELANAAVLMKHPSFSDEREARLSVHITDKSRVQIRVSNERLIPYTMLEFLGSTAQSGDDPESSAVGRLPLECVQLGPGLTPVEEVAARIALDYYDFSDVQVLPSTSPYR